MNSETKISIKAAALSTYLIASGEVEKLNPDCKKLANEIMQLILNEKVND